jgi:hypothetical protein
MDRLNSHRPVKQTRALLESNPPRDNWIDGDEIKSVSTFGEANTSPNEQWQTLISEPEHALKNSSKTISNHFRDRHQQQKPLEKNYLNWYPFFRSKPRGPQACAKPRKLPQASTRQKFFPNQKSKTKLKNSPTSLGQLRSFHSRLKRG